MSNYTTATLIESIKVRGMIPTSQNTFSDARFLALADEEIELGLLPLIMSTKEEFYVTSKDYDAAASISIPPRAIGGKIRDICLVGSGGEERSITMIAPEDREYFDGSPSAPGFYFQGNKVYFTDTPTESIRLYYYIRPSQLVVTTAAAQVTSIDVGAGTVDVSSLPSTITTSTQVDIIKASPGYELLAMDQTISNIASTTLTFSSLPSTLAVGDWIALAGESPIVQLPKELHAILAQRVAVKALEAMGDLQQMGASQGKLDQMEAAAFKLLEPRSDGSVKKIINRSSSLRTRSSTSSID